MKKIALLLLLTLLSFGIKAQTTYQLNYDSIRVNKTAGTGGTSLYGKVYLKNVGLGLVSDSILTVLNGRVRKIANPDIYVTPELYGAVGNGVTDDLIAMRAWVASGRPLLIPAKTYLISDTLLIPNSTKIFGMGENSVIKTNANKPALVIKGDNIQLTGFKLEGSGTGANNNGIDIDGALDEYENIILSDLKIDSFGNAGIYIVNNVTDTFKPTIVATNVIATNNEVGFYFDERAEYSTFANCVASGNSIGVKIIGGNNNWVGGIITENGTGVYLGNGINDGHSVMTGTTINHNINYSIHAVDLENGYTFNSCMIFINDIKHENSFTIKYTSCDFRVDTVSIDSGSVTFASSIWRNNPVFSVINSADTRFMDNDFLIGNPSQEISEFIQTISSSAWVNGMLQTVNGVSENTMLYQVDNDLGFGTQTPAHYSGNTGSVGFEVKGLSNPTTAYSSIFVTNSDASNRGQITIITNTSVDIGSVTNTPVNLTYGTLSKGVISSTGINIPALTTTTQTAGDNSTKVATTAYVDNANLISASGFLSFSGDGTTTTFSTGVEEFTTDKMILQPTSSEAAKDSYLIRSGGTWQVVFLTAPSSGTNNITFHYIISQ